MSSEFSSSKASADSEFGASSASTTADTKAVDLSVVVTGSAASATVWASSLEVSPSTNTYDLNPSSRKFGLRGWDEAWFQCSIAGSGSNNEIGSAKSIIDSRSVNLCSVSCVLRLVLINFSWLKPRSTWALDAERVCSKPRTLIFVIFMSSRNFSLWTSLICLLNSFAHSSFIYVLPSLTPFCLSNSQSQTKSEKGQFFMASARQVLNRCDNFCVSSLRKMVSILWAGCFSRASMDLNIFLATICLFEASCSPA